MLTLGKKRQREEKGREETERDGERLSGGGGCGGRKGEGKGGGGGGGGGGAMEGRGDSVAIRGWYRCGTSDSAIQGLYQVFKLSHDPCITGHGTGTPQVGHWGKGTFHP